MCSVGAEARDGPDGAVYGAFASRTPCVRSPERKDRRGHTCRKVYDAMRALAASFGVGALVFAGCGGSASAGAAAPSASVCRVTVVSAATRPPRPVPASFNYGNAKIAVALSPTDGKLVAGRLRSGGSRATINTDGSIYAKYGWWRAGSAKPVITGWLVTDPRRHLRASVPGGYGGGFQATGLTFPTTGCWRVTGLFAGSRLAFTVLVTKSPLGP